VSLSVSKEQQMCY